MLCEKCGVNLATIHLSQNINGKKTEMHVCGNCAGQMGYLGVNNIFNTDFFNILTPHAVNTAHCPSCGASYEDYRATKRIGCKDCYSNFESQIQPILDQLHGSHIHTGKLPVKADGKLRQKRELERMKKELKEAILNEEFEKAAKLRDNIKEIEGGDK